MMADDSASPSATAKSSGTTPIPEPQDTAPIPEPAVQSDVSTNYDNGPRESYKKLKDPAEMVTHDEPVVPPNSTEDKSGTGDGQKKTCCGVLRSARFQVYASHFLSSWGDRMWMFAGGLFLLEVTPGSLRLAAVYGAALALTVIIGGAPVGRWVDNTKRLTTAQVSLTIQNLMVCLCAALLVVITTQRQWFTAWDGWSLTLAEAGVILTACMAQIGTLGCKLAIEKDWIIVICGKDQTKLARMNSVLRTVDLSTEVFAPVIVGVVMSGFGLAAGGIFIAAWNVGSLLMEYGLLHHLYYSIPDLQKTKNAHDGDTSNQKESSAEENASTAEAKRTTKRYVFVQRIISAWEAWVAYMTHPVRNAGLALSSLFMTVLAFDNYSRAYVYESGVSETILGVLTAVASLSGICGSLLFPILRRKIGVSKTGLFGFGLETICLSLCFASVFAPGSPFDASALLPGNEPSIPAPVIMYNASAPIDAVMYQENRTVAVNVTLNGTVATEVAEEIDYTSVILLLSGIIASRCGLWIADLTVTQILQEGVEDCHRGAINGVQSSLNQSLDLMRSILIIILPKRETFGLLIMLSVVFVSFGWLLFAIYARKNPNTISLATTEGEHLKPIPA